MKTLGVALRSFHVCVRPGHALARRSSDSESRPHRLASRHPPAGRRDVPPRIKQRYFHLAGRSSSPQRPNEKASEAKRTKARRCCIPPTTADPDGGSALEDDEDTVQAFTRDGMSTTLLPFSWNEGAPTALYAEGNPSWVLDAGRDDAWQLASELLDQTLSLPARRSMQGAVLPADATAWARWQDRFARFFDECHLGRRTVPVPMTRHGDTYRGWLLCDGRRRRVLYTPTLGLWMSTRSDEEESR